MPKRSNEFQQLIHHIHTQIASENARVTESAILTERDSGAEREVDILIEDEVSGITVRIAVECRDRARRDTLEWVDGLIGKYRDLNVDKVVAVSRSGFSPQAEAKATANQIDTRTLEQASHLDWHGEFAKLGIAKLTYRPILLEVRVNTDPQLPEATVVSGAVTDTQGRAYGTLDEVALDCFHQKIQAEAREYVESHFFELFEAMDDIEGKALLTEQTVSKPGLYLTDPEGIRRRITNLVFRVLVPFAVEPSAVERLRYGDRAQITTGSIDLEGADTTYSVDIVQSAGEQQGRVFFKPAKPSVE